MGFFSNSSDDKKYSEQKIDTDSSSFDRTYPFDLTLNDVNKEITNSINSILNSSGVQSIWDEFKPLDRWEQWGGFKRGRGAVGLKAYPSPTLTDYSNCVKNDGVSTWDENGWWRCLFPRSKITNPNEISKEDVENDSTNKYGLFFNNYNDLMDWRLRVRELTRKKNEEERRAAREAREASNIQAVYDEYAKDVDWPVSTNDGDNDVVKTSKSVYFKTLPNGDAEEITKLQKVFRDGSTKNEQFKKLIPKDGGIPIIEDLSADGKHDDKKLTSWFWDEK